MTQADGTGDARPTNEATSDLWMIVAIVQPFKLDAVRRAVEAVPNFCGITVSDCRGFGHGMVRGETGDDVRDIAIGARPMQMPAPTPAVRREPAVDSAVVDFTPKVKLEIAVATGAAADEVVRVIAQAAHTGRRGDGKIFVVKTERVVRIRTFEEGASAV
ncbi:MAG: P-II family nitrogen regulator [Gemmatimonadetes bacterium]|nr:P-II family nitrogen regulator [Gemmatimonadota bacterium]